MYPCHHIRFHCICVLHPCPKQITVDDTLHRLFFMSLTRIRQLQATSSVLLVYIDDNRTNEDAFKVARRKGRCRFSCCS
ncbi:hypothetical protein BDA96_10G301800 [Sorghum bicolor]|uniref:Uncharacterized protein n=1 Tax=Sorghum bicolor TaxID=4558 RepID=A0A921U2J1_SORBI|nr:hypothetical protein BDA96_10G301800 [Sorghum bicolor]